MSYLTGEEKKEYKQAKKFFGMEMGKILVILLILSLVLGIFGVGYKLTIGRMNADADRVVFEHTKSYVEGMIGDLADYQYEFTTAETDIERKAIGQLIRNKYADFDYDLIDNIDLKLFLQKILRGDY